MAIGLVTRDNLDGTTIVADDSLSKVVVGVSAQPGNTLSTQPDGLFVPEPGEISRQWHNVLAERDRGVTYTNTHGHDMTLSVSVKITSGNDTARIVIDGVSIARSQVPKILGLLGTLSNMEVQLIAPIPPGASYEVSGGNSLSTWNEYY